MFFKMLDNRMLDKKGIEWRYLAAIILAVLFLILLLVYVAKLKSKGETILMFLRSLFG